MRRLGALCFTVLLLLSFSASVATADTCACGGWLVDRSWNPEHGHYDCLWYSDHFWQTHNC